MSRYRYLHEGDEVTAEPSGPHNCQPTREYDYSRLRVKNRAIVECNVCGQRWWAHVYSQINRYSGKLMHYADWYKLRWYHYKLRRYVR